MPESNYEHWQDWAHDRLGMKKKKRKKKEKEAYGYAG